jgi:ketosteroid isomerase-like protein
VSETRTDSPALDAVRERNANTVRRMYQCERDRDLDAWATLWNPDARAVFPACGFLDPIVGLDALKASTAPKFATRGDVEIREEVLPLVDPSKVLARVGLSIEVAPGDPPFESEIWVLFSFDDDGRILEHAEMFDSANYRDILSRPTNPFLPQNLRPGSLPGVA